MLQLVVTGAIIWTYATYDPVILTAQERNVCVAGVAHSAAVYIDSTSSEVFIVTIDGRQLAASSNLLLCPGDEVRTGPTGRVTIRFDQKRTVIRLDGNSRAPSRIGNSERGDSSAAVAKVGV